mmetsp:Transcript_474/g.1280  ORF Transcript_474/g.1280 Transcript_474/m.1280 type:complete len:194 (+) Transcript_474:79-660(+)
MGLCCSSGATAVPDPPAISEILQDLPTAERKLWRIAFASLDSTSTGKLASDHELLKIYLLGGASTLSSEDDVATAIAQYGSQDGTLDLEAFCKFMENYSKDDTMALLAFQQMTMGADAGQETMDTAEARTQLLLLAQGRLNTGRDWDEPLWEQVLDAALADSDYMLDMESWVSRCGLFTRYVLAINQQKNPLP